MNQSAKQNIAIMTATLCDHKQAGMIYSYLNTDEGYSGYLDYCIRLADKLTEWEKEISDKGDKPGGLYVYTSWYDLVDSIAGHLYEFLELHNKVPDPESMVNAAVNEAINSLTKEEDE